AETRARMTTPLMKMSRAASHIGAAKTAAGTRTTALQGDPSYRAKTVRPSTVTRVSVSASAPGARACCGGDWGKIPKSSPASLDAMVAPDASTRPTVQRGDGGWCANRADRVFGGKANARIPPAPSLFSGTAATTEKPAPAGKTTPSMSADGSQELCGDTARRTTPIVC